MCSGLLSQVLRTAKKKFQRTADEVQNTGIKPLWLPTI